MNFYVGNSIEKLNILDYNVEIDDDLLDYIYKYRNHFDSKMKILIDLDQFSDVILSLTEVKKLEIACQRLLDSRILNDYEYPDEAITTISNLITLCNKAHQREKGLISMGD